MLCIETVQLVELDQKRKKEREKKNKTKTFPSTKGLNLNVINPLFPVISAP